MLRFFLWPVRTAALATKSKGRSIFGRNLGDKNKPLSTVDRVEHVRLWRQCRPRQVERASDSRLSTNWRQVGDTVESFRRFVDCRLCRQCVAGGSFDLSPSTLSPKLNMFNSVDCRKWFIFVARIPNVRLRRQCVPAIRKTVTFIQSFELHIIRGAKVRYTRI